MSPKKKAPMPEETALGLKKESAFKQGERRLIKRYCGVPWSDIRSFSKVPKYF
jgi:hypothetical protein